MHCTKKRHVVAADMSVATKHISTMTDGTAKALQQWAPPPVTELPTHIHDIHFYIPELGRTTSIHQTLLSLTSKPPNKLTLQWPACDPAAGESARSDPSDW